jgi:hypothetical protein
VNAGILEGIAGTIMKRSDLPKYEEQPGKRREEARAGTSHSPTRPPGKKGIKAVRGAARHMERLTHIAYDII